MSINGTHVCFRKITYINIPHNSFTFPNPSPKVRYLFIKYFAMLEKDVFHFKKVSGDGILDVILKIEVLDM